VITLLSSQIIFYDSLLSKLLLQASFIGLLGQGDRLAERLLPANGRITKINSKDRSTWDAISCTASQEILPHLWSLKAHYRAHKSPPLDPILSQDEFTQYYYNLFL
jgi:hypothetical protein